MSSLNSHQLTALREIRSRPGLPTSKIDGRTLRSLVRLALVTDDGGTLRATDAGRAAAEQADHASAKPPGHPVPAALSDSQEKVLRYLVRQTGPVPADHLDRRVLRALASRGLVVESQGWVRPTEHADACLTTHTRRARARKVRRAANPARAARAEAILSAVQDLELALPRGAELMIATVPAYGDDVIAGLRALARTME